MYSAWFVRAVIFRPASYAALKTVVETWQTPPPRPVCSSPLMITGASRKPFSALRSPVVSLNENSAPGAIFSFNEATGARTADKGFKEAPVIINGELKTGLGGGVCQVSTTVFNAAYEAGLPIVSRTNHALYISHYPQGRDATVDYPDVDLKFVNDTGHWLLLRTWVGASSLTVALYGTPVHRRVVTDTRPLVETASAPVEQKLDPSLPPGARVVDDSGEPARSTSVRRRVYTAQGKLLYDTVFSSSYRAEPELVRVGPAPTPKPAKPNRKSKPKPKSKPPTTTATTTTAPTTTQP